MVYRRARTVKIEAYDGFNLCFDGELIKAREATVENMKQALHFIIPRDSMITPAKIPALVK
jgi:diacylglycerol kinase family enzyme